MISNFKRNLVRTSALVGATAAAVLTVSQAHAADITNGQFVSAGGSSNNVCIVRFSFDVTGTTDDSSGNDFFSFGVYTRSGARYNAPRTEAVPVGTTTSYTRDFAYTSGNQEDREIRFFDSTQSTTNQALLDPKIADIPIPRSALIAAGGGCAAGVGPNASPDVNAGPDQSLGTGGGTVNLNGTASDPDNDPLTYTWSQFSGPSVSINNANSLSASFTAPAQTKQEQRLVFQLVADDGTTTASDFITVVIAAGPNTPPSADAGTDRDVNGGSTVTLDASNSSDADNDPLTYSWTQTGGPAVTLDNANSAVATFTAPAPQSSAQTLTFTVTVSDGTASATDTVVITVLANQPPTADAGPDQTVSGGSEVEMSGSASDPENDPLTVQWMQTAGPSVTLSNPNNFGTSFTAPSKTNSQQVLTFQFTATDSVGNTTSDTTDIFIVANVGPTADAGPDQSVSGGQQVTLDASGSTDGDGDALSYSWTQTSGPSVTLSDATAVMPTFDAPPKSGSVQTLTFEVTVSDGLTTSNDTVTISVAPNDAPLAEAGPDQAVSGGDTVTLDGTGSADSDGDPLTYFWAQQSGPSVNLSDPNAAMPSFTAPQRTASVQTLVFELTVSDGSANSTDTVTITVGANQGPTADAGTDQAVAGGDTVTLDASGSSDPDGDPLTYSFVQTGGPSVTLNGANTATPSFTAPSGIATTQVLTFEVTVSDGIATSTDVVEITVAPNSPPVADAGADQGPVDSGQTVTLDGSGSTDPDDDTLTYSWTQVSGTPVTLSSATAARPTFTAPSVNGNENLVFQLVVNDGQVDSAPDTVTIAVRAIGTITIVTNVIGDDVAVNYTSNVAALNTGVTTNGGTASLVATGVAAGNYTFSVPDLRAQGYALTAIACNDADSTANAANGSIAIALNPSEDLVCTVTLADSRSAASEAIGNFLAGRNALLLANQPNMLRRVDRLNGRSASGSANVAGLGIPGSGALPFAAQIGNGRTQVASSLAMAAQATGDVERSRAVDVWADIGFADVTIGQNRGNFVLAYVGVDVLANDDLLIGALAQFDRFSQDGGVGAVGTAEGDGWMVGPYATARIAPRFYADARVAFGRSDNSLSPLGTYVDGFDTDRFLAAGSLLGDVPVGKRATFWPEVGVRYIRENQAAYTDSLNVPIPSQTVDQGEVAFSPRLDFRLDTQGGWLVRPYVEAEGLLTFGSSGSSGISVLDNGLRGRVVAGIDAGSAQGFRINLTSFYDGIGEDNYEAAGVSVGISFSF